MVSIPNGTRTVWYQPCHTSISPVQPHIHVHIPGRFISTTLPLHEHPLMPPVRVASFYGSHTLKEKHTTEPHLEKCLRECAGRWRRSSHILRVPVSFGILRRPDHNEEAEEGTGARCSHHPAARGVSQLHSGIAPTSLTKLTKLRGGGRIRRGRYLLRCPCGCLCLCLPRWSSHGFTTALDPLDSLEGSQLYTGTGAVVGSAGLRWSSHRCTTATYTVNICSTFEAGSVLLCPTT